MPEQTEKKEKKKLEPVTEKRGILYEIARVLALFLFHTFMPVKCIHREKLDMEIGRASCRERVFLTV